MDFSGSFDIGMGLGMKFGGFCIFYLHVYYHFVFGFATSNDAWTIFLSNIFSMDFSDLNVKGGR